MREVQIVKSCDMCYHEYEGDGEPPKIEATHTVKMAIALIESVSPPFKVLDLCDMHVKAFTELHSFINDVPLPAPAPAAPMAKPALFKAPSGEGNRMVHCPVCQKPNKRATMVAHVWQHHRKDLKPEAPVGKCPDCNEHYDSGQGMSAHRRSVHGYDALIEALAGVKGYKVTGKESEFKGDHLG